MVILCDKPFEDTNIYTQYFERFSKFKLSDFQKWAIKAIVDGDNIMITAHTGSLIGHNSVDPRCINRHNFDHIADRSFDHNFDNHFDSRCCHMLDRSLHTDFDRNCNLLHSTDYCCHNFNHSYYTDPDHNYHKLEL